jgi:hypothetical protein
MKMVDPCGIQQESSCVLFVNISLCHEPSYPVGIPAFVPVVSASLTDVPCVEAPLEVTFASEERNICPQNLGQQLLSHHPSSAGFRTGMIDLQIFLAFIGKMMEQNPDMSD